MTYLCHEGARTYLNVSKASFFLGLISWSQLLERLKMLVSSCEQTDPTRNYAQRILRLEEVSADDDWPISENLSTEAQDDTVSPAEAAKQELPESDRAVSLIPDGSTGLSNWQFHIYDDDFFPSVPHGHARIGPRQKLDSYLGWVYQSSEQVSREPRWKIIALWNDSAFRLAAGAAVEYFTVHHPHYAGWRVVDPRRLPRRRR
jgi:hypothetical protein